MNPSIFISAGEASGEHYGAMLIDVLKDQLAAAGQSDTFFGMGGERMEAAGLERITRSEEMAVMGLTEVLRHLPRIYGEFRKLKKAIRERRPRVAVLIDFPGFHFKLAEALHREGIPVVYFVSPQLWAWKKHRIKKVRKFMDRMLVIFPFEELFYRDNGVKAEFVGHPLAEQLLPTASRKEFAAQYGLNPAMSWIGLLPGSRPREIRDHLPEMLRAARGLTGDFEFLFPLASTLNAAQRAEVQQLAKAHSGELKIHLLDEARAVLQHARVSVVASGTATVEAALVGNPFVVVYRVSALTYQIAKRVVTVSHIAMANLIAGKRVVPELIQGDFTAENIVQQLERLLPNGPARQSMMEELAKIRGLLAHGTRQGDKTAIERVAEVTLEVAGIKRKAGGSEDDSDASN